MVCMCSAVREVKRVWREYGQKEGREVGDGR
jgi:hypothetical protein